MDARVSKYLLGSRVPNIDGAISRRPGDASFGPWFYRSGLLVAAGATLTIDVDGPADLAGAGVLGGSWFMFITAIRQVFIPQTVGTILGDSYAELLEQAHCDITDVFGDPWQIPAGKGYRIGSIRPDAGSVGTGQEPNLEYETQPWRPLGADGKPTAIVIQDTSTVQHIIAAVANMSTFAAGIEVHGVAIAKSIMDTAPPSKPC